MAAYTLRHLDEDFWRRVKAQAALEGHTIHEVILQLLKAWLHKKP